MSVCFPFANHEIDLFQEDLDVMVKGAAATPSFPKSPCVTYQQYIIIGNIISNLCYVHTTLKDTILKLACLILFLPTLES